MQYKNLEKISKDKKPPILYETDDSCCGCYGCYSICPKKAITMEENKEGFKYPVVDIEKCIYCYSCLRVCPIKKKALGGEDA